MKIKKIMISALLISAILSSLCMASPIPESRFSIGGITPNSSPEYVESIYGLPADRKYVPSMYGRSLQWSYNGTFIIRFADNAANYITVKANNGIKTADGIHVGSTLAELKGAYGEPIHIRHYTDTKNKTMMYYYEMKGTPYYAMYFTFNEKNEIIEYTFGVMDGVPFSQQKK